MSEFATPQRVTTDGKENSNSLRRFDNDMNKLDNTIHKPVRKMPLGLLFETNRGILQSGAQRVLIREKEAKPSKVSNANKTNFMKPTEAYRNGHQNTPTSKAFVQNNLSGNKLSHTPTSITHPHSGTKQRTTTPKPLLSQHQVITTPARSEVAAYRASSTPPSAKHAATPTSSAASRPSGYATGRARDNDSVDVRAHFLQQSPTRSAASSTHTILFSPSNRRSVEEGDKPRRTTSAPRSRIVITNEDAPRSGHPVEHRLAFVTPRKDETEAQFIAKDLKKSSPPLHDLRHLVAVDADKRSANEPSPPTSSFNERATRPLQTEALSAVKTIAHKASVHATQSSSSHSSKIHLFKNLAPSSLLVTTADTLSANKAAKKAVIASLKTTAASNHHYSAATHSSAAAAVSAAVVFSTPSRKQKAAAANTPNQVKSTTTPNATSNAVYTIVSAEKRSPVVAAPSTPVRHMHAVQSTPDRARPPTTPLSAAKTSVSAVSGSGSKKFARKAVSKKVTISAASPTILNANSEPRRRRDPHSRVAPPPMFDVGRVLDSITSSASHPQLSSQQTLSRVLSANSSDDYHSRFEHRREPLMELKRSSSFDSEISSVRDFGGFGDSTQLIDISLAETINLSANTSMFESAFAAGTSDDEDRESLARLALEEGLMDVSAVCADATRCDSVASSSPGIFSSAAFAPICPSPHPTNSSRLQIDSRLVSRQQSRKPARHHHNTATVTSRSTDYANFYSQYGSTEGSLPASQLARGTSGGIRESMAGAMPTPIERSDSQHYLNNTSISSTPWSRQNSQQDNFRFSVDCDDASEEGDSALDRGMLVGEESVFSAGASSSASSHQLNTAMTMSSAFQFSPRDCHPAFSSSAANNFSMLSQLSSSFLVSASNTPRVRPGVEASRCSFVSTNSCPSELNRAMVLDESDYEEEGVAEETSTGAVLAEQPVEVAQDFEQSTISFCETTLHGRDSTFGSASSLLMTGDQQRQLDLLVDGAHFVDRVALPPLRDLADTTCIGVNAEDVHSLDSGYALLLEGDTLEGLLDESDARDASSHDNIVSNSGSEMAGSSGDKVNMDSTSLSETPSGGPAEDDEEEPFVFARRDSGEQDDTVLCEEVERAESDESFFYHQASRAFPAGDMSTILSNRAGEDSHCVDEESCATLHCSAFVSGANRGHVPLTESSSLPQMSAPLPRMAVSDSFELLPRSASALPVPVTHVSSTPVTKSYLDFERKSKLGSRQSPFRSLTVVSPLSAELEPVLNGRSPSDNSDSSSQPFVSSLPVMFVRQEAQPSDSPSRAPPSDRSDALDQNQVSVTSNSGFSTSSVSMRSSCTDELQRLNPRGGRGVDEWAREQYGDLHGGASCFLDGNDTLLQPLHSADAQDSYSFDGVSLLADREDDNCCPDPLFSELHSRDAWESGDCE